MMKTILIFFTVITVISCSTEFKGFCRNILDQHVSGQVLEGSSFNNLDHAECLRRCHARAGATGCNWETDYMDGEKCWSYTGNIHMETGSLMSFAQDSIISSLG